MSKVIIHKNTAYGGTHVQASEDPQELPKHVAAKLVRLGIASYPPPPDPAPAPEPKPKTKRAKRKKAAAVEPE